MINFFKNRRKKKFLNRLKYGQDEKPVYTTAAMTDALMIGDEEKAEIILHEIIKRRLKDI